MTMRISGGAPLIHAALAALPFATRQIYLRNNIGSLKIEAGDLDDAVDHDELIQEANTLLDEISSAADEIALAPLEARFEQLKRKLREAQKRQDERSAAAKAKLESKKLAKELEPPPPPPPPPAPIICNAFQGKFCPIVNVGGTISLSEPNAGSGTFETEDLGVDGPEYNYSPARYFDQLGLTLGVENRMIKWGPDWLLGIEGQFEKIPWNLDGSDRHDPLKSSQVVEIDYGVALTVGAEFPIEAGLFRSIKIRAGAIIPQLSRARYKATVDAEGQSEGVIVTGTHPTRDASDRPGNPAVQDWSSARSAPLHGFDLFFGGSIGPFSEAGFIFRWRNSDRFGDSVGNEGALASRCEGEDEMAVQSCIDSIPEGRRDIPIEVQGPERNAAILFTLRGQFDIAQLLGQALGRK